MSGSLAAPVIAGMAVGIVLLGLFSLYFSGEYKGFNQRATSSQISTVLAPSAPACAGCLENFEPQTITVVIGVNNTVRWINHDLFPTILEADNDSDPLFYTITRDFVIIKPGNSFEFTFTKPGEFGYHGKPHQRASITVLAASNDDRAVCGQSIESIKQSAPFTVLLPEKLPAGYKLQSADYAPGVYVTLKYFTKSPCDPTIAYSPDDGEIEIVQTQLSEVTAAQTGKEYTQTEMTKLAASNINATSYVFQNGRMYGVGYGDQKYQQARLIVVDDKTGTIIAINARSLDMSLETLATIAGSLKE